MRKRWSKQSSESSRCYENQADPHEDSEYLWSNLLRLPCKTIHCHANEQEKHYDCNTTQHFQSNREW